MYQNNIKQMRFLARKIKYFLNELIFKIENVIEFYTTVEKNKLR